MPTSAQAQAVPRLTYLRIKNYRALRDVEFRDLTPLTVLIGPNGSGKSTVLDALDFLAEAVRGNLVQAWKDRSRFAGIQTRGSEGNIRFEVHLLFKKQLIHYELEFEEYTTLARSRIFINKESVWKNDAQPLIRIKGRHTNSNYKQGHYPFLNSYLVDNDGDVSSYSNPDYSYLASSLGGSLFDSPELTEILLTIKETLLSYRKVHLADDHLKGYSDAGPQEYLASNGDNLPNVLYYLHLRHPAVLARLTTKLKAWVPGLADVIPEITSDERLLLRFKDAPFEKPLPAQYMSGGTMRLVALLTLLYEPDATGLLGIEEPENELHPQLLYRLAEELLKASETRQLLVATHSPFLLDALAPEQVWVLHRGADGYTQATRTADIPNVQELVEDGSPLGYLWSSNFFPVGDPLDPRSTPADAR